MIFDNYLHNFKRSAKIYTNIFRYKTMMKTCLTCFSIVLICTIFSNFSCKSTPKENEPDIYSENLITQRETVFDLVKESALLNVIVRRLGDEYPVSISIVSGTETRWVQIENPAKEMPELIKQIAANTSMACQNIDNYFFLYPAEQTVYETLTRLSISEGLPEKYKDIIVSASFGAGTQIFNVLNSLNFTYGCNIVADNSLAELPVGELVISKLPLITSMEMIFKSARVVPQNLKWCATDNFIFLYTPRNTRIDELSDCKAFHTEMAQPLLEKEVIISLPKSAPLDKKVSLPFYNGAMPLSKVAPALANQTGLTIEMLPGTENLPVNPCYLNKIKLKIALDLLVFQWLDKSYSYFIDNETIVFTKQANNNV